MWENKKLLRSTVRFVPRTSKEWCWSLPQTPSQTLAPQVLQVISQWTQPSAAGHNPKRAVRTRLTLYTLIHRERSSGSGDQRPWYGVHGTLPRLGTFITRRWPRDLPRIFPWECTRWTPCISSVLHKLKGPKRLGAPYHLLDSVPINWIGIGA